MWSFTQQLILMRAYQLLPYLICKSNFIGSVSVFTAAIQNKVKRIVFAHPWQDMEMLNHHLQKIKM